MLLAASLVGAAIISGRVDTYQVQRLTGFLDQKTNGISASKQTDAQYSLKQSKTAIASGGLTGTGFGNGLETKNGFVAEQHTDFIFTAVGEDLGFIGGATLLAIGVLAMFAIQVFENVGMTMGIMPITGIPLPFMSYGGSAIIASFVAIGLVANVHMRRFS